CWMRRTVVPASGCAPFCACIHRSSSGTPSDSASSGAKNSGSMTLTGRIAGGGTLGRDLSRLRCQLWPLQYQRDRRDERLRPVRMTGGPSRCSACELPLLRPSAQLHLDEMAAEHRRLAASVRSRSHGPALGGASGGGASFAVPGRPRCGAPSRSAVVHRSATPAV